MESVDVLAFYRRTVQTARFLKVVPAVFKEAFIIPLLKKPDLDSADPRSQAHWRIHVLKSEGVQLGGLGERCKLPQRVRAEPGR